MRAWWKSRGLPVKTWIVCWVIAFTVPVIWITSQDHLHGAVDGQSLEASVHGAAKGSGSADNSSCDRKARGTWQCDVDSDSGVSDSYLVAVKRDSSCWTATRLANTDSAASQHLDGCVSISDAHASDDDNVLKLAFLAILWLTLVFGPPAWAYFDYEWDEYSKEA